MCQAEISSVSGGSNTDPEYIVIQAGGLGSRLGHLTANKPKAIVSVDNLPIIFHLFRKYPSKRYVIIGDYKKDVLDRYLDAFAEVEYLTVGTDGNKGTCSGIHNAIALLPPKKPFMLIWSDLILGPDFTMPGVAGDYIGISKTFSCRWSYVNDEFREEASSENGVAGLFVFKGKESLEDVPESGEFVRWLQLKSMTFKRLEIPSSGEYGLMERIRPAEEGKCRPFNQIEIQGDKLVKKGIDAQGKKLAVNEVEWYRHAASLGIAIPKIYSYEPLTMEYIEGKSVYGYGAADKIQRIEILEHLMDSLNELHEHSVTFPDYYSIKQVYLDKTFERLSKVRDMIPLANEKVIVVNGKRCRNVFFFKEEVARRVSALKYVDFCLIHGDCTFSNILVRKDLTSVFIDPRGYFGTCRLIGDPRYDWAKLYYSLFGDYDQFNLGRFKLDYDKEGVKLDIQTNGWRDLEDCFIRKLPVEISIDEIRFIHALIWLALTTYAWNDYDSICGAFYNGLYYLEDVL